MRSCLEQITTKDYDKIILQSLIYYNKCIARLFLIEKKISLI